jgi:hypothetical protein
MPSDGEVFAITTYDPTALLTDTNADFEIVRDDTTGECSIRSLSLHKMMNVSSYTDDENTLVVSFKSGGVATRWEFIPSTPVTTNWTVPSWLVPTKSGTAIPNLADGVYRITNGQTKTFLALGAFDDGAPKIRAGDLRVRGVEVTGNLKEVSRLLLHLSVDSFADEFFHSLRLPQTNFGTSSATGIPRLPLSNKHIPSQAYDSHFYFKRGLLT